MSGKASLGTLQVQVTVPSYFLCPISLELMRDPVTLSSGQTFDRSSIQQWLDDGHATCPVTRQPLSPSDLDDPIPNHTLRRMIQAWCVQNQAFGIDRILTPRQPPSLKDIPKLLDLLLPPRSSSAAQLDALQKLSRLVIDRPQARPLALSSGALPTLTKLLSRSFPGLLPLAVNASTPTLLTLADDALKLLDLLIVPEALAEYDLQQLRNHEELVMSLANALIRSGVSDSRARAASILLKLQPCESLRRKMGGMKGFITVLVDMLRQDDISPKVSLGLLDDVCAASYRNQVCAAEAGAVGALSRLLESAHEGNLEDKVTPELILRGFEVLCKCAEGRAALLANLSTLRLIVKYMTAVSEPAARHAVYIISLVVKWAPEADEVKNTALQEGALIKAIAVAQSAATSDTRLAARRLAVSLNEALTQSRLSLSQTMRIF